MPAVRIQLKGKTRAGIAEVPPDCLLGFAERLGYLVAIKSFRDEFHDLALRGREGR